MNACGHLYGISAGPGDPELISVKGLRLLQQAPIVAFPAGLGARPGIAQQIIQPWLQAHQVQLPLHFPYVQDPAKLTTAWQTAAQTVWPYLCQGQDVAFVSEGDVSFYSTFTYLAQTIHQDHPQVAIEVVPGICSPLAAAGTLGLPLVTQRDRLAVLPALYQAEELTAVLAWADVVVLLKVSSVYPQVWSILQQQGLLSSSLVVERATTQQEVIYQDLRHYPQLELPYFSLLMIYRNGIPSMVKDISPP